MQLHLIFTDKWPSNKYQPTDVAFKINLQRHNDTLSTHELLEMEPWENFLRLFVDLEVIAFVVDLRKIERLSN